MKFEMQKKISSKCFPERTRSFFAWLAKEDLVQMLYGEDEIFFCRCLLPVHEFLFLAGNREVVEKKLGPYQTGDSKKESPVKEGREGDERRSMMAVSSRRSWCS